MDTVDPVAVDTVAAMIADAVRVVVLTGAGVSTASGIPDFRGPNGLWTRDPDAERLFSLEAYLIEEEVRRKVWQLRLENPAFHVGPNPAHTALAALERLGKLHTLITQNVDGLHQAGGTSPDRVIEIHGTIHQVECLSCERIIEAAPVLERVRRGEPDPRCAACGGLMKSATVSFGQELDPARLQRAHDAVMGCDLLLAIGSSLVVHPVALLPRTAREVGATLIVINGEPTPYDEVADVVVSSDIATTLTAIAERVRALAG